MPLPRAYQTFAEFERDVLRGSMRLGQTLEEMVEDSTFDADLLFDKEASDDDDDE